MQKESRLRLRDVIVVLAVVFLVIAISLPVLKKIKRFASGVVCATNLKGLGTAIIVYANDYDGMYPQLPGKGPWSKRLGFDYYMQKPDFTPSGSEEYNSRTISASWYLLVRECDVSPKSVICTHLDPKLGIKPFDGRNPEDRDIVELWDFGPNPYKHVSYSMHYPYGNFPAHGGLSASFAIASDMNPWFKNGNIVQPGDENTPPRIIDITDSSTWAVGNSVNHVSKDQKCAEGQNVLYMDGHACYEKGSNVGINKDNIYTFWSTTEEPTKQDIQGGTNPTSRSKENDAKSKEDSFLAI